MTTEVAQLISLLGFPAVSLIAIGIATWRAMTWAAPMLKCMAESHIALMDTLRVDSHKQTFEAEKHADFAASINESLDTIKQRVSTMPCITIAAKPTGV